MRIAFLGDIAFIGKYDLLENKNARNRLRALAEKLLEFDYVVANLESPFSQRDKTLICKSVHLKSAPINVELLKYQHIDAVSLANNHICDYGKAGLVLTIKVLEENQLEWFGGLVFFQIEDELQTISEPLIKINNRKEYEERRKEQIQRTIRGKFGRHDFMWYRNRLNYYSIGAYILACFRKKNYQRVAKEFIYQSKDFQRNKVLYIGNFSFPMGNAAGKRVYANGKLLGELGYEIIFIGMDKKIDASIPLKNTKSRYDGFTYYNFSYPKHETDWLRYKREFTKLIKLMEEEELIQNLSLVIYYGEPRFSLFLTLLIRYLRRRNIKVVSDCVDWLTTKTGHYLFDLAKGLNDAYEKIYANIKTDGIIAISSYLASFYENQGCNTVIIPPLSLYEDVITEPIASGRDIVITYAGEPFRKGLKAINRNTLKDRIDKMIILLYEAKKQGYHFLFHIYGFTKEEYLMALPSQKKYLDKLEPDIVFHGYKQNIEVMERIRNSDFTILIRDVNRDTTAGFPTKISESISCGTPVITNRTSDLKYYIIEGKNGFFLDVSEKRKAVEKITSILSMDREEIYRMKKYCAQSRLFYYKNYIGQMEDFIHKL